MINTDCHYLDHDIVFPVSEIHSTQQFSSHTRQSDLTENNKPESAPPSYREALSMLSNNKASPLGYNEVELFEMQEDNNQSVITTQPSLPDAPKLNDININGITNGDSCCLNKNISSFNLSKDYLAFNKNVYCHPFCSYNKGMACNNMLQSKEKLITFNIKTKKQSILSLDKPSNMQTKNIIFSEDNKKIISLCDDGINSEIYISFSQENIKKNKLLNIEYLNDCCRIDCPMSKIYDIFSDNSNLYAIGIENDTLKLLETEISDFNKDLKTINWKENASLSVASSLPEDIKASFSKTGKLLFVLTANKTLYLFSKDTNWEKVKVFYNVDLPKAVNSSEDTIVFVKNNTIIIKNIISDEQVSKNFQSDISTVCFIPETTDLLVFTSNAEMILLKQNKNNLNDYYIKSKKTIDYLIKEAYFAHKDNNQLIVLIEKSQSYFEFLPMLITGIVGGFALSACGIGCIEHLHNTGPCCCSCNQTNSVAAPDPCECLCSCCTHALGEKLKLYTLMGTYAGLGAAALSMIYSAIYSCTQKNTIPADFTEVKKTNTK